MLDSVARIDHAEKFFAKYPHLQKPGNVPS
jgi:hypothetical protein